MPFGIRAPSDSKCSGLRRKSTISCSSSFASSRPATSDQVTADAEPGVISIGLTRGISLTVFQSSQTTRHMRTMNDATGAKSDMNCDRPNASIDHPSTAHGRT